MHTGWLYKGGTWYYLNPSGAMQTGWGAVNGTWYFFDGSGAMYTGWLQIGGTWYYLNGSGAMHTGWLKLGNTWYYLNPNSGNMVTGWNIINGTWYYLDGSGAMRTGWLKLGNTWYYLNSNGGMHTGWLNQGLIKYYLDPSSGAMYTGVHVIGGKSYNFGSSGGYRSNIADYRSFEIRVNRSYNTITVYGDGEPIKAIVCSVGRNGATPVGTFTTKTKLRYHELNGPTYGQYCQHITSDILFHSVPSKRPDTTSLYPGYYNQLGTAASAGCIRLTVADAKWLYDYMPLGTKVVIYDDASSPGPLGKPTAQKIPMSQTWDPTDPAHR